VSFFKKLIFWDAEYCQALMQLHFVLLDLFLMILGGRILSGSDAVTLCVVGFVSNDFGRQNTVRL
jgi:hypothetical protein